MSYDYIVRGRDSNDETVVYLPFTHSGNAESTMSNMQADPKYSGVTFELITPKKKLEGNK
jgi:hypothetical protein